MAGMWCPRCRGEYREGFTECADCGVALVPELVPEPAAAPGPRILAADGPDADSVELARLPALEAEVLASLLPTAGVRAFLQEPWAGGEALGVRFAEGVRVLVRRADLAAAREVLADFEAARDLPADVDASDLAEQAEAAADWSDPDSGAVV